MKPDPIAECEHCHKPFVRRSTMQKLCGSYRCAIGWIKAKDKAEREDLRRRKEAVKPRKALMSEAIEAFNRYIRLRDHGKSCICCGKPMPWHESTPGGYIDAGHFMSTGSCPELRFDEVNVNAQLKGCNRPGGTTRGSFRAGMVARWGEAEVERLEGPHTPAKWTSDDLREIRDRYRAKARALKNGAQLELTA